MEALAALRPMLAVTGTVAQVAGGDHLHEIKWDGARVLVHLDGDGGMVLRSRSGMEVTPTYPELADLAGRVDAPAVLDGEVVAVDAQGVASFARLQTRFGIVDPHRARRLAEEVPVQLVLFDALVARGAVLLACPLEDRRAVLADLGVTGGRVQLPPVTTDLDTLLEIARQRGDEGVVSKRRGSPYLPGRRSTDWIKLPFALRRDVVIGGWRPEGVGRASGPRRGDRIGAILAGAYDEDGRLRYLGAVGSGLAGRAGDDLRGRLEEIEGSPFADEVPHADARYAAPRLVASVRHRGITGDGRLRQPVWLGLRDDLAPDDVTR